MDGMRNILVCGVAVVFLAAAVPQSPETAEAGTPAPLPTQIPIRDINSPPTPNTPPVPFSPKPSHVRRHRVTRHKKRAPRRPPTRTPAPTPRQTPANPAMPRLEQRYEAPTESLYLPPPQAPAKAPAQSTATPPKKTSGPVPGGDQPPATAQFPPEPAPAPAPQPAPMPAPGSATPATPNQAPTPAPAPAPAK